MTFAVTGVIIMPAYYALGRYKLVYIACITDINNK
jgi:hypothetical protein